MSVTDTSQDQSRPRIDDVDSAYPLLVDNMDNRRSGQRGNVGNGDLGSQANETISSILGWRGRTTDAAGFQAALKASFSLNEVDGHVVAGYTARSLSIQADLGALTGAQASLYARAKSTETLVVGLIDGLTVLDPTADLNDTEALRRLVRESVLELVGELGIPGGPRVPRVNTLFTVLTGTPATLAGAVPIATRVGGQLGQLRDRFGLVRSNINDLNNEQVFTSFFTVVDAIGSLQGSWAQQRKAFSVVPGSDTYLGPELVLLSRDLAAASEQLEEVRFLLESVFVGPAEQQTILVRGVDGAADDAMALSDLMSWLEDFLGTRGPRLISESGRDGIQAAFMPMAVTLSNLVGALAEGGQAGWPRAMSAMRVVNGFGELSTYLTSVLDRVRNVTRYGVRISEVKISHLGGPKGRGRGLMIFGDGFRPEHSVVLRNGAQVAESFGDYISTTGMADRPQVLHVQVDASDGSWQLAIAGREGPEQLWSEPVVLTSASAPRPGMAKGGSGVPPQVDGGDVIVRESPDQPAEIDLRQPSRGGGSHAGVAVTQGSRGRSTSRTSKLQNETRTPR